MYLGRYILGDRIPLGVPVVDGPLGKGRLPDAPPTYTVYSAAGAAVAAGRLPPADVARAPGQFAARLALGAAFAAGHYRVALHYLVAGVGFLAVAHFEVLAGGAAAGAVVSAQYYERPHASFLVTRTDGGRRVLARNPRL